MAKKDQDEPQSSQVLARIAENLYTSTDPVRQSLIGNAQDFLSGGFDPTTTPGYGARKSATEQQFTNAKDAIIASNPAGGALTGALTNFETSRAMANADLVGGAFDQSLNLANMIGFGAPLQTSTGGLSNAANIQAQVANANAMQNAAAKQGIGYGVGASLGGKEGK